MRDILIVKIDTPFEKIEMDRQRGIAKSFHFSTTLEKNGQLLNLEDTLDLCVLDQARFSCATHSLLL